MEQEYIEEKTFNKIDFTQNPLIKGEYESCNFISCDFSNSDLTDTIFMECECENCNLSMARLIKTALREIRFRNCKMLGLHFENCNKFGLSVDRKSTRLNSSDANISYAVFCLKNKHNAAPTTTHSNPTRQLSRPATRPSTG